MSSQLQDRTHPVAAFAGRLSARLDELADVSAWTMRHDEQRQALKALAKAEAQLTALRMRVLAVADRSGATEASGAATAADWVAIETRQVRRVARAELHLAEALARHQTLACRCAAGDVNPAQARAIVTALNRLPARGDYTVSEAQREAAEEHLVGLAAHHDAKALAILG